VLARVEVASPVESSGPETFEPGEPQGSVNLLHIALRHKSLLGLGAVIGGVLGAIYFAQKAPVYESSAQLIVIKKQGNPLPGGDADPRSYFYDDFLATHQVLIKSPLIVLRAVEKHQLHQLKSFQGNPEPGAAILGSLAVLRDAKDAAGTSNNVLTLAFSSTEPEDCATVLNAVIDCYKDYLDEKYKNVSEGTVVQIVQAMESLQKDLTEKKKAYAVFQESSPLVYWKGDEGSTPQEEWLGQIQSKRLNLLIQRAEMQGRLDSIEEALKEGRGREALLTQLTAGLGSSSRAGGAGGGEPKLHEQMFDLMLKEQLLLADYGPDHPEVESVRKRMALTREFFARRGAESEVEGKGSSLDPVKLHVQALKQELADVDISLQALVRMSAAEQKGVKEISRFKTEDRRHREDIARLTQMLEPIIRRLEEIKLIRDLGGFDAEVIATPQPGGRTGTGAIKVVLLGGLLGLAGGLGLAFLAEVSDKSFRTPEEIRRRLGLPVVGHVPLFEPDVEAAGRAAADGVRLDPRLVAHFHPKSVEAEAFRGVRTALYFSTHGQAHQVIQVTSPNASEGKSTLTANLAISIAQSGKRTVLIDADFRKPRQHQIFGVSAGTGLASVIAAQAELRDAIQPTAVAGLSLLPCGPRPHNPAELLTSPRFKELLDAIRQQFDFVLVDTPPLLAVSDPSVVAPRVDGVLLAIKASKNGRPNAERAREVLHTLGATVLGVVVTGASRTAGAGGFGYQSGHYALHYGYGGDEDGGYYPDQTGAAGAKAGEAGDDRPAEGTPPPSREMGPPRPSAAGPVGKWFRRLTGR
jgi:capsular exopolysaccharide synthesis family protein